MDSFRRGETAKDGPRTFQVTTRVVLEHNFNIHFKPFFLILQAYWSWISLLQWSKIGGQLSRWHKSMNSDAAQSEAQSLESRSLTVADNQPSALQSPSVR